MRLGYTCQNTSIPYRCDRTCMMLDRDPQWVVARCVELAQQNVDDLLEILKWNEANGIKLFRIASDLLPHVGNVKLQRLLRPNLTVSLDTQPDNLYAAGITNYDIRQFGLERIGAYARTHGHRLTFHVTPYVKLGSPTDRATASQREIMWHAGIIEAAGLPDPVIIIHLGGVYGNKMAAIRRFIVNWRAMPAWATQWVAIENDESEYNINDVLYVSSILGCPVCMDYFHYVCYNMYYAENPNKYSRQIPLDRAIELSIATWRTRPKFHLAEQKPHAPRGAHADYIRSIPRCLRRDIDIMLEAKAKELALLALRKKYNL